MSPMMRPTVLYQSPGSQEVETARPTLRVATIAERECVQVTNLATGLNHGTNKTAMRIAPFH
eukprot:46377-Eustigmatos_ZCMA.PRE.1